MKAAMPHSAIDWLTGLTTGSIGGILLNAGWISTIQDAAVKVVVTVLVGICGGIAGLAGKDIYNNYLKQYFKKK